MSATASGKRSPLSDCSKLSRAISSRVVFSMPRR